MMPRGELASSVVAQADEMTHTQHLSLPNHVSLLCFHLLHQKKMTKQKLKRRNAKGESIVKESILYDGEVFDELQKTVSQVKMAKL